MEILLTRDDATTQDVLHAFNIYISTIRDAGFLIPGRLAAQFSKLKTRPLLQDLDFRALDQLRLDVHEQWLPEEVKDFTPSLNHDELQNPEAERLISLWAEAALSSFLDGTRASLRRHSDFSSLLNLRRDLLETLLASGVRRSAFDVVRVLDQIMAALMSELIRVSRTKVSTLREVLSDVLAMLADWDTEGSQPGTTSLWDSSLLSMDLGGGAQDFIQTVISRRHGRDDKVLRVRSVCDNWAQAAANAYRTLKQMEDLKWDEDIIYDNDELDLDELQKQISKDDPEDVRQALDDALKDALSELQEGLRDGIAQLNEAEQSGEKATFLLRVVREIRERLMDMSLAKAQEISQFGVLLLPTLHDILAWRVFAQPLGQFSDSIEKLVAVTHMPIHTLWVGTSPLPVQPSPLTFRFLHSVVKQMAICGGDLWAKGAVDVVKIDIEKGNWQKV